MRVVSVGPPKNELRRARERASGSLKPERGWSALRRHRIDLQCESHLELFSAGGEKMSHHSLLHLLQLLCWSVQTTNCFYFLSYSQRKTSELAPKYWCKGNPLLAFMN